MVKTAYFNPFFYGHEFESQTCIIFFIFLFIFLLLLASFVSSSVVHALHDPRISRDSQVGNIFFTKSACCQFTFNSIIIMATLLGASENDRMIQK